MNWKEDIYFSYINLNHRQDRNNHMILELNKHALGAVRFDAISYKTRTWDYTRYGVMLRRTPGAVGCWESQVSVMKKALSIGMDAGVMEDDLIICSDFAKRMDHIEGFVNHQEEWDVVFLGGTVHVNPPWWHTGMNHDLPGATLGRDAECTIDPNMLRVYGAFSTHAYIVNHRSIEKVLGLLDSVLPEAMGIDWAFIKVAPQLKCFMFVPGCIKQMDNMSDIGNGMTIFSGFSKIGPYWWTDKMEDFHPASYNWGEAKI